MADLDYLGCSQDYLGRRAEDTEAYRAALNDLLVVL